MEVYYGAEEADQRCANMVNEDMVERRPANRTPLPRHEPPIKARFNETITHFQKVITARHGESPAYLGQLRKELNIFNLWGDGLYASEGGLDKCLRNSEDLKKSVESRLDAIRDVLTRELQPFPTTLTSNLLSASSNSPRRPETYAGEFLEKLGLLTEGLLTLTPSIEITAQAISTRSRKRSAAINSSGTVKAQDSASLRTQRSSTVATLSDVSIFSRLGANDNDVASSAISTISVGESISEVDYCDSLEADKSSSTSPGKSPHKSCGGVPSQASLRHTSSTALGPEETDADKSADEAFFNAEETLPAYSSALERGSTQGQDHSQALTGQSKIPSTYYTLSTLAQMHHYLLVLLQRPLLYLLWLLLNLILVIDRAVAGGCRADGRRLEIYGYTKEGKRWNAVAQVDTAADVSIMCPSTASRSGLEHDAVDLDSNEDNQVQGVAGEPVKAYRKLKSSWCVQQGHKTFETTFFLVEMPAVDVILGRDWLEAGGYIIYLKSVLVAGLKKKKKETPAESAKHAQQKQVQAQRTAVEKRKASDARAAARKAQEATAASSKSSSQ